MPPTPEQPDGSFANPVADGVDPFPLPEFTRSLRGFASVDSLGAPDHAGVFAPLLTARRAAARVTTLEGRLAAFDAARLRRGLDESIEAIAASRAPKAGAERRALRARLAELADPARIALDAMELAAADLRAAPDSGRSERWIIWIRAIQALFDGTDRFWIAVRDSAPPPRGTRRARRAAGVLLLAALGAGVPAVGRAQHVPVRIAGVPAESLLKHGFDVAGVERNAVIVIATPAQRARLDALGWRGTVVLPRGASPQRAISAQVATPTTVYRSFDDPVRGVRVFIDSLARNNSRISVDTLGLSYEGRPMLAVKVGTKGDSPSRPNVLFMATYHAREWAATEVALRLLLYLANSTGDPRIDSLLQTRDIWIMPVANPDGYQYTFNSDRLWRKTRSPQAGGNFGVDMNRNHRQNWGLDDDGSSPDPASDIYRGPSPASEIEVRNVEKFHAAHPPVATVTYHTYAGLLMYAPSATYGPLPADLPVYRTLAGTNVRSAVIDRVPGSQRTFYAPSSAWMLYTTNGEYADWASTQYGTIAFTPEMTSGYTGGDYYGFEFPDDEGMLECLFNDNLPFALDVIESARDPFGYVSPTTFFRSDRVVLESVSPDVRATIPAAAATGAHMTAPGAVGFHIDSGAGGHYTRRLISAAVNRPATVSVSAAGQTANFSVLAINGAERNETGWVSSTPFVLDSLFVVAGKYSWYTPGWRDAQVAGDTGAG